MKVGLGILVLFLLPAVFAAPSNLNVTGSIYGANSLTIVAGTVSLPANQIDSGEVSFNYAGSASKGGAATTATALAANGANCGAGSFPLGVDASGAVESCSTSISGNAGTASALAADGTNCGAGQYAQGVDAAGNAQGCAAPSVSNADTVDNLHAVQFFNAHGQNHGTYTSFDGPTDYGFRYIVGTTNGPGISGATQYYNLGIGLGADYGYNQYAMQMAIPRTPSGGSPYMSVRFREGGTWGSWSKIYAGYADSAGTASSCLGDADCDIPGTLTKSGGGDISIRPGANNAIYFTPSAAGNVYTVSMGNGGTSAGYLRAQYGGSWNNNAVLIYHDGSNGIFSPGAGNAHITSTGGTTYQAGSYNYGQVARVYYPSVAFNADGSSYAAAGSVSVKAQTLQWGSGTINVYGSEVFLEGGKSPNAGAVHGGIQLKTAEAVRMYVDGTGNVGIGTTSPNGRLDVSSNPGNNVLDSIIIGQFADNTQTIQTSIDGQWGNWGYASSCCNNLRIQPYGGTLTIGTNTGHAFVTIAGGATASGTVGLAINNPSGYYDPSYPQLRVMYADNVVSRIYMDGSWNTVIEQLQPAGNGVLILKPAQYLSVSSKRIADVASPVNANDAVPRDWALANVGRPSTWTCTTRTGSCTGGCYSSSASCSGSERLISGGCYAEASLRGSYPSGQGWACSYSYTDSIYAYAQCCY